MRLGRKARKRRLGDSQDSEMRTGLGRHKLASLRIYPDEPEFECSMVVSTQGQPVPRIIGATIGPRD